MTQNVVTSSTPSTPSRTGMAVANGQPRPPVPPPLGGTGFGTGLPAGPDEGVFRHRRDGVRDGVAVTTRCAFDACQAGGVILPGAPVYVDMAGDSYHPGCWAAWWLKMGQAVGRMLDRATAQGTTQPVAVELDMSLEVTAR